MRSQVNRKDVITEARKWLGVRWRHQGRTRLGIDCAGLVILVGKALGVVDYDTTNYQRRTHGTSFLQHFRMNMEEKAIVDVRPGDVLLFRDNQFPCHSTIVGEIGGALTIIHAHALLKKVLEERLDQADWMERRVACFEYRGIKD